MNSFDKHLNFYLIYLQINFPNILTWINGISVYCKDTSTWLHVNYTSFVTWNRHTAWIRSLVTCALKICSCNKMSQELKEIKKFTFWNDFPKYIVNSIFRKTVQTMKIKVSLILQQNKRTCCNLLPLSILWK